nr:hypothetical protein [Interfilum sp. SAG 36.88]
MTRDAQKENTHELEGKVFALSEQIEVRYLLDLKRKPRPFLQTLLLGGGLTGSLAVATLFFPLSCKRATAAAPPSSSVSIMRPTPPPSPGGAQTTLYECRIPTASQQPTYMTRGLTADQFLSARALGYGPHSGLRRRKSESSVVGMRHGDKLRSRRISDAKRFVASLSDDLPAYEEGINSSSFGTGRSAVYDHSMGDERACNAVQKILSGSSKKSESTEPVELFLESESKPAKNVHAHSFENTGMRESESQSASSPKSSQDKKDKDFLRFPPYQEGRNPYVFGTGEYVNYERNMYPERYYGFGPNNETTSLDFGGEFSVGVGPKGPYLNFGKRSLMDDQQSLAKAKDLAASAGQRHANTVKTYSEIQAAQTTEARAQQLHEVHLKQEEVKTAKLKAETDKLKAEEARILQDIEFAKKAFDAEERRRNELHDIRMEKERVELERLKKGLSD